MAQIEEKDLLKLSKLCRIDVTPEESNKFFNTLSNILAYIAQLDEVDTTGVSPCNHVLETMANVVREDEVKDLLPTEEFLANSASHVGGMVRVPVVMKVIS